MKCTGIMVNAHGADFNCKVEAKWWVQDGRKRPWVPRCGRHAAMPPFTSRKRIPITEPRPEWPEKPSECLNQGVSKNG